MECSCRQVWAANSVCRITPPSDAAHSPRRRCHLFPPVVSHSCVASCPARRIGIDHAADAALRRTGRRMHGADASGCGRDGRAQRSRPARASQADAPSMHRGATTRPQRSQPGGQESGATVQPDRSDRTQDRRWSAVDASATTADPTYSSHPRYAAVHTAGQQHTRREAISSAARRTTTHLCLSAFVCFSSTRT